MENNYPEIRELLQQKADYQARLNLLPSCCPMMVPQRSRSKAASNISISANESPAG